MQPFTRDLPRLRAAAQAPAPAGAGQHAPLPVSVLHHPYVPTLAPASLILLVPAGYLAAARRARERRERR